MRYFTLLVVLMSGPLFASGDDVRVTQSNDMNNQTTGDVSTGDVNGGSFTGGSNKSLALVNSLGDVDINDCLGSTQWATPVFSKQKLNLNKWCAAEVYDAKGMYTMGGRIRCQIPEIAALFDDAQQCVLENTVPAPIPLPATTPPTPGPDDEGYRPDEAGEVSQWGDGHPGDIDIVQRELAMHEEEYESLEERLARLERNNQIAARKSQERRDYAQQTIQRLENDPEE